MFRRRRTGTNATFKYEWDGQQVILSLRNGTDIPPVSSWTSLCPATVCAVAEIEAAAADARCGRDGLALVEITDSSVRLHPEFVASLDAVSASAIGMPPPTGLGLDLKPIGRIDEEEFHIQLRWFAREVNPFA